ncbi:hypothetical protein V1264_023541 [Littorina saxatilis]
MNDASDKTRVQDTSEKTRAQDSSEKTRAQDASEKTRAQDASEKTRAQDASEKTRAQDASEKTRAQVASEKTRAQNASEKTRAQDASEKTRAQDASEKTRTHDASDKARAQNTSDKTRAQDTSDKTRVQGTSEKTRAQDTSDKTRVQDTSDKTRVQDTSDKTRVQGTSDKTRVQDTSDKTRVQDTSDKTRVQDTSDKTRVQDTSDKTRVQDTSDKTRVQDTSDKTRVQDTSDKTRVQDTSDKTRVQDTSDKTRVQDTSDKTRVQDTSDKTRVQDTSDKTRVQDTSDKTRVQGTSDKTRAQDTSDKTRVQGTSEKTRAQDTSDKTRVQDTSDKKRVQDTSEKTKALDTSDKKRAQESSDKTRVQDASDGEKANNTSEKLKVSAAPEKLDSNDSPIRPASTEQSPKKTRTKEIQGNTLTIHLASRKPRTCEENSKQAMFHADKVLPTQHGTSGDTKTDKIMLDLEHQQERGTSSQSVDATARKVTKRKADSSNLPTAKQAMEREMHDFLVKTFPGLHKQTYFVPPILFNVAKRAWATQFHGCFTSELTPQSNVRADEARERILKCLQELSTIMTCFVMSGVIFDEYLNKRTRLPTDKPGEKPHIPFPKPGDLASQYRRGEIDVMIFHKSYGIIIIDVKAVGDTFDEMSVNESEKLDLIIKVLEKVLALIRKEREVILHLVSDIPCTIPVSAMLVLPNLSRSLLKDALDLQPVLREELATALRTTRRVEDVCLCADDLPAKHQAMTDENARNFAQCWKQQFPDKEQIIDDGVYEQIIGRFCGPFSSVTVWTSEQQRAIVRTLGQAVHETGRRFTAAVLFPQHIEVLDSIDKYVYINGSPGSGKTMVLTVKGLQWVKAGSYVCVLTIEAGTSPVSLIIHQQIVDALHREEDTSGSGKIDTDSLSNDTDDVKTSFQHLVNRLKQRADGRLICLIVDEIDVADFPAIEQIIDQLPECRIWCAGIWAANGLQSFVLKQLPISFRCPPAVQTILQLTEPSARKAKPSLTSDVTSPTLYTYVTDCTQIDECPLPTTGVRPMLMSHANHGSGTILDCSLCGDVLAAYLKDNLRVGTDIPANDILIVTADTQRLSSSQNVAVFRFVKALQKQGMEVNIIARYSGNELAFPLEAKITLTSYELVAGLERKVVVFLPGGTPASVGAENEVSKVCYNDGAAIATCAEFTGSNAKCHPMEIDDKPEGDVSKSEIFTGQSTQQLSKKVMEEIAVVNKERKANTEGGNKSFDPYGGDDEEKGKGQTGDRTTLHKEGYKLQPTEIVPSPNRNEHNHSCSNTDDSKEISSSPSPAKEEQSSQGTSQIEKHKGAHVRKGSLLQRPALESFEHQTGSTDKKRKSRGKNTRKGKSSKHGNHDKSHKENIYDLMILNPSEGEDDENEKGYDRNTSDSSEEKREGAEDRKHSFAKEEHSSQGTGQTKKHKSAHLKKGSASPRDALGSLENQKGSTDKKSRGKNTHEGKSSKRGNLFDESHRKNSTSEIDQENVYDLKKLNPSDGEDDQNDKSCDHNTSHSLEEKREGAEDKTLSEATSSKGRIKEKNITDNCREENKTEHVASTNSERTTAYASRARQTSSSTTQDQMHVPTPGAAALSLTPDIRTCLTADDDVGFRTVRSSQPSRQECSSASISEGTISSLEQGIKEVQVNAYAEDRTETEADLDARASANRPVKERQMRSYDSRLHEAVNQLSVSNRECMWYAVSCARAHVVIFHFPQN